jgi:hypothetical protein
LQWVGGVAFGAKTSEFIDRFFLASTGEDTSLIQRNS